MEVGVVETIDITIPLVVTTSMEKLEMGLNQSLDQ